MNVTPVSYNAYSAGLTLNPLPENNNQVGKTADNQIQPQVNSQPFNQNVSQAENTHDANNNNNAQNPENHETSAQENKTNKSLVQSQLTEAELRLLTELKQTDTAVRRHEMAHVASGGQYITSGAQFTYKRGPDGNNYAVGGEVGIDTSPIPGDPQATIQKMRQIKNAALAPANPSAQDLKVASKAASLSSQALSELLVLQAKEQASKNETQVFGNSQEASDSYIKVNNLPEESTSTFQLAV